jgi:hypothetical protein
MYLDIADLRNLAALSQKLVHVPGIPVRQLVRLAAVLRVSDRRAAAELFRAASHTGIPDELVSDAYQIALSLGLAEDAPNLLSRLIRLGNDGKAGTTIYSYAEFVAWTKERQQHVEEIQTKYRRGQVPVHFVAVPLGWNVAELYHGVPSQVADRQWMAEPPMALVRNGVRDNRVLTPGCRVNMDITALLLAAHLDLLPAVEAAFGPLRLPQSVTRCLAICRDQLLPPDLTLLEACRIIAELLDRHQIRVFDSCAAAEMQRGIEDAGRGLATLIQEILERGGRLVMLEREDHLNRLGLSPEAMGCVIEPAAVTTSPQTSDRSNPAPAAEEGAPPPEAPKTIPFGAALYIGSSAVYEMARGGVLARASTVFEVHIFSSDVRSVRSALIEEARRTRIDAWLGDLQERIRMGIQNRRYQLIPQAPLDEISQASPLADCLQTILHFTASAKDVIWIDDRSANAFVSREDVPIVCVTDILDALLAIRHLTEDEYYGVLLRLRAGNFGFIPISPRELVYHVRKAPINDEGVVETPALATLRRYLAACYLLSGDLNQPIGALGPGNFGELSFAFELDHNVSKAISRLWESGTERECSEQSRWLLRNLSLDPRLRVAILGRSVDDDSARRMKALHVTAMLGFALTLWSAGSAAARQRFVQFSAWLEHELFEGDQRVIELASTAFKELLSGILSRKGPDPQARRERIIHQIILDLPEELKAQLASDEQFAKRIGLPVIRVARVGTLVFPQTEYFAAAADALAGRDATVLPVGRTRSITFKKHGSIDEVAFSVHDPESDTIGVVADPALSVLVSELDRRIELLSRHQDWFEGTEVKDVIGQIAAAELSEDRLIEASTWRDESSAHYYRRLEAALRETQRFTRADDRLPNVAGYLRYFRLTAWTADSSFADAWSGAIRRLLADGVDPAEVFIRAAGVPLRCQPLEDHLLSLPVADADELLNRIPSLGRSPQSRISELRLVLAQASRAPEQIKRAQELIDELFNPEIRRESALFLAMLRYVEHGWVAIPEFRALEAPLCLALVWAHTHRLFALFDKLEADHEWMAQRFDPNNNWRFSEMFAPESDYRADVVHPDHVNPAEMVISGVAGALQDYPRIAVSPQTREEVERLALVPMGDGFFPSLSLMRDVSPIPNALNSYLGQDKGVFTTLLGADAAAVLSSKHLQDVAEALVQAAKGTARNAPQNWALLDVIISSGTPRPELLAGIEGAFRDYHPALAGEIQGQLVELRAVARLARFVGTGRDDILDIVRTALTKIPINEFPTMECDERCLLLIVEIAYYLAQGRKTAEQDRVRKFSGLIRELVIRLPRLRSAVRPIIEQLGKDLPTDQAQILWPLLVLLRSLE